ncbi:hypothetical protein GCM10027610_024160 [Dactylosporangium cerinum]
MRMAVVATPVGALLAAIAGFWYGWHGSDVDPSPPAAVCPMLRSELLDRLVPQHRPPSEERFLSTGVRGSACTVTGPDVDLDLAVMRFGRHDGLDPINAARQGMLRAINRRIIPVVLGDEAWHFRDGPQNVYLMARLGTTVVQVRYAAPLTEDTLASSATVLAQEVLAQL